MTAVGPATASPIATRIVRAWIATLNDEPHTIAHPQTK